MQEIEVKDCLGLIKVFIDEIDMSLIPDAELNLLAQDLEEDIFEIIKAKKKKHSYYENAKRKAEKPP